MDDAQLFLTPLGLAGDTVTHSGPDSSGKPVHGGYDRAVYAFPWELHGPVLKKLVGPLVFRGRVGENLRVDVDENLVHVGDVWEWGEALLQVTGPRVPGPTLATYFDGIPVDRIMTEHGMCGWFLRVLRPGLVNVMGKIKVVELHDGPTIAEELRRIVGTRV